MRIRLFLVCLLLSFGVSYAAIPVYFDFSLPKKIADTNNELTVVNHYNLVDILEDRFLIRPVVLNGGIEIFDQAKQDWVMGSAVWSSMPRLSRSMQLKLRGSYVSTDVYFQILDTKTSTIYETPKHILFNRVWFKDYIERLNINISKW